MALADRAYPFGLREVDLTPLGADGSTLGTPVALPAPQTLSFGDAEDFETLRGGDEPVASHGNGTTVEWSLEAGGISLEAYAVMAGGAVVSSGVTPNIVKTYTKKTDDSRPYFRIRGRSINDNGGDFKGIIYKAKADGTLEGELSDGGFFVTSVSGHGFGSTVTGSEKKAYDFIHSETAAALVP